MLEEAQNGRDMTAAAVQRQADLEWIIEQYSYLLSQNE
jgi:hypothetical protein